MIHNTSQCILWIYNLQFCHNMWHVKIRAVSWSLQRKPFLPPPCGPWSAPLVTVRKYRSLLARTLERHAASQRRPLGGSANSDELRGEDYFRRVLDSLPMNRSLGKKFRNKSGIVLYRSSSWLSWCVIHFSRRAFARRAVFIQSNKAYSLWRCPLFCPTVFLL